MKRTDWLFNLGLLGILCLFCAMPTYAQKGKDGQKDKTNKDQKNNNSAAAKANANAAKYSVLDQLTREEKNTMTDCPLHGGHMSLSDNYRANATDFRQSGAYPFAYQLNYRRSCKKCTNTLVQEERALERETKRNANAASFERCPIHNEALLKNGEESSMNYSRETNAETPHAQQYKFKFYCKTCTKIHKINNKDADKEQ
ncbi:MAG: hypothetical protein MK212_01870 [Saprospiraceae bacterium]|nr:hypothetical protein [Saprospiraceae bacterium]